MEKDFKFFRKKVLTKAVQMDTDFEVATVEGIRSGKSGDYLCLDSKGNPYPYDKLEFETLYEEVNQEEF